MPRHTPTAEAPRYHCPAAPTLAVCGWSGAGKTTLLERVIPALVADHLRVAVVKHDAHGLKVDTPGKDSDRFFCAGADVIANGPAEGFARRHAGAGHDLGADLDALAADHDIILVEGHKDTPLPKVWLTGPGEEAPPARISGLLAVLPRESDRPAALLGLLRDWLPRTWAERPLWGGILIGGSSRRMGTPKQVLTLAGMALAEIAAAAIAPHVAGIAVLGAGEAPASLADRVRLADAPDARGPLAGMLAAMRWQPGAAWLMIACDLPLVTPTAAAWLVSERAPGRWAVIPRVSTAGVEPLFAVYEPQARGILEKIARDGLATPRLVAEHPRCAVVCPPEQLALAWSNANSPEDLARLIGSAD